MKKYILIFNLSFLLLILFLTPDYSIAQSGFNTRIQVSTQYPKANEEFSIGLVSSETDLNRAKISWYLNDKLGLSGIGKTGFRSRTGPVGTYFEITAVIDKSEGGRITKTTIVRPQEVDILWKAYSYTPPFYRGKALAPSSGLIILTAMPNMIDQGGKKLDPKELIYTWSERGLVLGNASGFGKQSIILENGQIEERLLTIGVIVSSFNKTVVARGDIKVPVNETKIILYEKRPLEGIRYEKNIENNFSLIEDELTINAEPYFFSLDDMLNNLLNYSWKVNNRNINIPNDEQNNSITFRHEGETGTVKISLEIENNNLPFRILQDAKKSINIKLK